jgi:hypothetical protein
VSGESDVETGRPTVWDNGWREGHAHGLEHALGISYHEAFLRTMDMLQGKPLNTSRATPEDSGVSRQNKRGEWVPDIPLPLFVWPRRHRCGCGRSFWTMGGYQGHYAFEHILGLP